MLKLTKMISMFLVAVMSLSLVTFAQEVPYSYVDQKTDAKVTIYDPNISVTFSNSQLFLVISSASPRYIRKASTAPGNPTDTFLSDVNDMTVFTIIVFEGGPRYNVSLCKAVSGTPKTSDPVLAVAEDTCKNSFVTLSGLQSGKTYYFRVSTWDTPGNAYYYIYGV